MPGLSSLYREALAAANGLRGLETVATLSRLHRVQGSEELVIALEHLAGLLEELGVEAEVEVLRGPLGLWEHYGFWEPRGWRLGYAEVSARRSDGSWETIATTRETPLTAMVHSPPGTVEATATYTLPGRGGGGGVALTPEPGWEGYYVLTEQGYEAVIGFHTGPGTRYWGLYPPPFTDPPRAPAASIPGDKALNLHGEKLRVIVEAEYTLPVTPVLRATIGNPGDPQILILAHACHPSPGAHDNASGAAAAAETAAALAKESHVLKEKGVAATILLAPEWTGAAAAIQQGLLDPSQVAAAIALDMVAADPARTGGAARLVTSPPPLANPLDPVLDTLLRAADPTYRGTTPYEWGSDHDIAIGHGVPASLVNDWPDKYYHTSHDTPDHIDPTRLQATAAATAAAALALATQPAKAIEAAKTLTAHQLAAAVLNGGDQEAATQLARETAKHLEATRRLLEKAEPREPWQPELQPTHRPPHTRTYIHIVLRDKELLQDKQLRTTARTLATIMAATRTKHHAELHHRALTGRKPSTTEWQKALKLINPEEA